MAVPNRATAILESVTHYHRSGIWWVHAFLLMPDHVHALICVAPDHELALTVQAWKGWQTRTQGIRWQSGFFDHRLRSDESHQEKAHYINQNPVRAGLVAKAEDWPFVWRESSLVAPGSPGGFALPQTKVTSR